MKVRANCPRCALLADWELDLHPPEELAWREGEAPTFGFACARCAAFLHLQLAWRVEVGAAARVVDLLEAGGPGEAPAPRLLLVADCPHQCGQRLGLRLDPDDPSLEGPLDDGAALVLGGYRCARCGGEGRLCLTPLLREAPARPALGGA